MPTAIIKLSGAGIGMAEIALNAFDRATVFEIRGDTSRSERVAADAIDANTAG